MNKIVVNIYLASFEREYIDSIKWRVKGRGREEKRKKTTFRPLGFLRSESDLRKPSGRNVVFFLFSSLLLPFTLYFIAPR